MHIIDLTAPYLQYLNTCDLEVYEQSHPELFDHYFRYWGDRSHFSAALKASDVQKRKHLIVNELPLIEKRFAGHNIPITDITIVLLVGQNYTNGHAAKWENTFMVWLPIEAYETTQQVLTFIPHEIAHALHYRSQPAFYFGNRAEKELLSRLLITEGLATYVAQRVMKLSSADALWADYLPRDATKQWMVSCAHDFPTLCKFIHEHLQSSSNSTLFYTSDAQLNFRDRSGYYVGLKLMEWLNAHIRLPLDGLLRLPKESFVRYAKDFLSLAIKGLVK